MGKIGKAPSFYQSMKEKEENSAIPFSFAIKPDSHIHTTQSPAACYPSSFLLHGWTSCKQTCACTQACLFFFFLFHESRCTQTRVQKLPRKKCRDVDKSTNSTGAVKKRMHALQPQTLWPTSMTQTFTFCYIRMHCLITRLASSDSSATGQQFLLKQRK